MSRHRIPAQRTSSRPPAIAVVPARRAAPQQSWIRRHRWETIAVIGAVYALLFLVVAL